MSRSHIDYAMLILRVLGVVLICAGLFLYEDEEGKIQNKVEEWWIKLSDKQEASRSGVAAFMREVARLTGRGFDRLFGRRLFSLRVVPVSIYLSFASLFLLILLALPHIKNPGAATRHEAFLLFLLFLGLALVPALFKNKWLLGLWWAIIPAALVSTSGFVAFVFKTRGARFTFGGIGLVALLFAASLVCDLAYIALTRSILRRITRIDRIPEIVLMILANLMVLAIPLLSPIYGCLALVKYAPRAAGMVLLSLMFNAIDFLVGCAALFLALLLLLHRLFWPAMQRLLYAIYRFAPIKEKKWLVRVGGALLILPNHFTVEVLEAILAKLQAL